MPEAIFSASIFGQQASDESSAVESPTATATKIAIQRSPAEPEALAISASATIEIRVRNDNEVILRPPNAWTRLPFGGSARVYVFSNQRRSDKADRLNLRVIEHAETLKRASLSI